MSETSVGRRSNSIYGTVLTIALIAAYSADEDLDPLVIAAALAVTLVVFWLAHVQAQLLALRYAVGHALERAEVRGQFWHSWPLVQAGLPPLLALLLGVTGLVSDDTSIDLALGIGVAELAAWGVAIGRREGLGALRTLGVTAVNVSLGLAVVILKLIVH
jgi:hypothetical protein